MLADPDSRSPSSPSPSGDRDPEALAQRHHDVSGVDPVRHEDRGDDRRPLLVRGEELEAHGLRAFSASAAERRVPGECVVETFLEEQTERDVQCDHDRDGRGEGRRARLERGTELLQSK